MIGLLAVFLAGYVTGFFVTALLAASRRAGGYHYTPPPPPPPPPTWARRERVRDRLHNPPRN